MSPTLQQQTRLISGVNCYIASQTAKAFLDAGFSVRGTARSEASSADLKLALTSYVQAGRFSVVEVKDVVSPGAFDEAVKGCHAITHMASPVSQFFTDPEPVINTAVQGTMSVLNSAIKYRGSTLKSVVLMSSNLLPYQSKSQENRSCFLPVPFVNRNLFFNLSRRSHRAENSNLYLH